MSKLYDLLSAVCSKIKKPDWDQNDPTAADYVKNRPFYTETVTGSKEILPESSYSVDAMLPLLNLEVGEVYTVVFDGNTYEITADDSKYGKPSLYYYHDNIEIIIRDYPDYGYTDFFFTKNGTMLETATFGVYKEGDGEIVHKIPEKYLPAWPDSDWNAAEGEPGHILNRPFYSEYGEETVILPETTITVEEMAPIEYPLFIIAGEEYTVSWNRTVYHCTAVSYSEDGKEGTVLGDLGMITNGVPTTGEPFVLLVFSEEYAATEGFSGIIVPLDGATELTISITSPGETVTPIPKKYLPELRGQKKYVLDLDKGITPALEEVCKLDTAELQASLVCIHEGVEKSVIIVNRTDGYYEGMYIARLDLYVPLTYGKYNYYRWDTISGFQLLEEYWTPEMIEAGMSGTFMLVRQQNEAVPNWRRINEVALPGIVLSSTTQGSTKKFLITVDDSGNLTAAQN